MKYYPTSLPCILRKDQLTRYICRMEKEERNVQENIRGTQHVSMMSGEIKDFGKNDLDFTLAITAAARASEHLRDFDGVRMKLFLLIANEDMI